jgi:hypothetical protein
MHFYYWSKQQIKLFYIFTKTKLNEEQGVKYSKECRLERWVDVEEWDESHGIAANQCHRTSVDVLRGRLTGEPTVRMDYALSLLTSVVRFMSFLLNSPHPSWSRSYSGVYIPDKKLILPIFWIFLILNIPYSKYRVDNVMPIIK